MSEFEISYIDYTPDLITYNSDKIKAKSYTPKNGTTEYKIFNCDDECDIALGIYKSIVVNPDDNTILCFTPPKTVTMDFFKENNPDMNSPDILINEIIEGTMLTLFYDPRIESWELASKGAIGGNYWFYRTQYKQSRSNPAQPTFRKMFLEAFRACDDEDINDLTCLQELSKEYCYNFIVQHPSNHIVLQIESPVAYLVSVYHLKGGTVTAIPATIYEEWNCFLGIRGLVEFPKRFDEDSYDKLEEVYCSMMSPRDIVGLMFTNLKTGIMASLENPTYKEVRELRGNNPNLQYQYLCLLRMGKVMDFLNFFPQYKDVFYRFYKEFHEFVTNVHQSYISYYVRKSGQRISKKYFPLIYKLHHEVFLPSLVKREGDNDNDNNSNRIIMRRTEIGKRLVEMPPSELIYYLNYNKDEPKIE
jgi:hypothetical protein